MNDDPFRFNPCPGQNFTPIDPYQCRPMGSEYSAVKVQGPYDWQASPCQPNHRDMFSDSYVATKDKVAPAVEAARYDQACQSKCREEKNRCDLAVKDRQYTAVMQPGAPGLDLYNGWKAGRLERYTNSDCHYEDRYTSCRLKNPYSGAPAGD